jgi:putative ABC transport system permease protein
MSMPNLSPCRSRRSSASSTPIFPKPTSLSYLVTQRTSELGIRIALGAQRPQIMRLTLADGLAPVLIGLILGLAGGAAVVRLLREMLYGMSPFDWNVFSTVVAVLAVTAACACLIPAWRASRLDPVQALRTE